MLNDTSLSLTCKTKRKAQRHRPMTFVNDTSNFFAESDGVVNSEGLNSLVSGGIQTLCHTSQFNLHY